ncbi:hypothetical protein FEDK69T_25040 [Flavobacterium enshiense DK69]|uniref:Serine protease n=1 Tax=Flavobacterium enshiense DK69 TaxID=1107311 RepID=V6S597_9FLAO|nr:DNA/RNA non-specific endonuclease [Flavobacterium enshiense]ESU21437.1 hypothetical protein FEDK69T_25040 [Flavobacterium enshiense DK69]KGO97059.1 hypothetical protein Q767_00180 [Flavobacterium enshiense DK69]
MTQDSISKFEQLIKSTEEKRDRVRHLVDIGQWTEAETDQTRKDRFVLKNKLKNRIRGKESQIGDTLDWIDTSFLTEGSIIQQAVGYVTVRVDGKVTTGSGFMISDKLFMTNNHIISSANDAENSFVTFNKENDENGFPKQTSIFRFNPTAFFITSPENDLDFSVIQIGEKQSGNLSIEEVGHFIISDSSDKHILGMNVNIIQHPLDLPKKVVFRNNTLVERTDTSLLYETDTENGSSGSPVLNDNWDLVAIHHWGEPYKAKLDNPNSNLPNYVNEGIRISSIYKFLNNQLDTLQNSQKNTLLEALSYAKTNPLTSHKVPLPKKSTVESTSEIPKNENSHQLNLTNMGSNTNDIKIQIPLEITIGIGKASTSNGIGKDEISSTPTALVKSEANKIDKNYSNRKGYNMNFITSHEIPLPKIGNKEDIAPLYSNQPNYKEGILKYEHFSIVINKEKRCAFYSATNIDGETYKSINRKTGEITDRTNINEDEGETWYEDDRINPDFHLNQPFFSNWSHFFDRGHLTRRTDTSWGTDQEALRADADTFHFSNCSIQHFRFNQTVKYWQGVERYILEKGVINDGVNNKISVFQGPIYNDEIDLWAGDFQIPSKYFKIAVWRNKQKELKSVGLIVDQSNLLSEERKNLGKPKPANTIDVNEWRVSIKEIERLTDLKFGKDIILADTISSVEQPNVGEEAFAKTIISDWDDLLK